MGISKNKCHQLIILMQLESLSKLFVYYGKEREDYVETRVRLYKSMKIKISQSLPLDEVSLK